MKRFDIITVNGKQIDLGSIKSLLAAGVVAGSYGLRLLDPGAAIDEGREDAFEALRAAADMGKKAQLLNTKD